jgi:hypothetical protein
LSSSINVVRPETKKITSLHAVNQVYETKKLNGHRIPLCKIWNNYILSTNQYYRLLMLLTSHWSFINPWNPSKSKSHMSSMLVLSGGPIAGAILFQNEVFRGRERPLSSPTLGDANGGMVRPLCPYWWYLASLYRFECVIKPSDRKLMSAKADPSTPGELGRTFRNRESVVIWGAMDRDGWLNGPDIEVMT